MKTEIEVKRAFKSSYVKPLIDISTKNKKVIQFYIGDGVAVYFNNERYAGITIKRKTGLQDETAPDWIDTFRYEFEYSIPFEDAIRLFRMHEGRFILKTRYYLDSEKYGILYTSNLNGDRTITAEQNKEIAKSLDITLDVFEIDLIGLSVLELEGKNSHQMKGNPLQSYDAIVQLPNLSNEVLVNKRMVSENETETDMTPYNFHHKDLILKEFFGETK